MTTREKQSLKTTIREQLLEGEIVSPAEKLYHSGNKARNIFTQMDFFVSEFVSESVRAG